jgi:hypothetical protein
VLFSTKAEEGPLGKGRPKGTPPGGR